MSRIDAKVSQHIPTRFRPVAVYEPRKRGGNSEYPLAFGIDRDPGSSLPFRVSKVEPVKKEPVGEIRQVFLQYIY
jgi:hypothetical protein